MLINSMVCSIFSETFERYSMSKGMLADDYLKMAAPVECVGELDVNGVKRLFGVLMV